MEVLRRCPLAIAQRLVHCAIALSTAVLDRVTKTMSVAPLLMNNLDNSKQKTSNLLSPAPPPYSWSLLGKIEGPAPPPSSKISWSFDLAWSPHTVGHETPWDLNTCTRNCKHVCQCCVCVCVVLKQNGSPYIVIWLSHGVIWTNRSLAGFLWTNQSLHAFLRSSSLLP